MENTEYAVELTLFRNWCVRGRNSLFDMSKIGGGVHHGQGRC